MGQLSDTYISYVDIAAKSFTKIQTGNSWNEELAIDDTGTTGMLTTGTAGDAMSFSVTDAGKTHGQTAGLTGDAGGVAFFPGTLFAFVVQAPTQLTGNLGGYNVIDASNPATPKVTDSNRVMADMRISYPVTSVPSRKSVVYPSTNNGKLSLIEMGLEAGKAKLVQTIEVVDAMTLSYGLTSTARRRRGRPWPPSTTSRSWTSTRRSRSSSPGASRRWAQSTSSSFRKPGVIGPGQRPPFDRGSETFMLDKPA